jgi:hypothetical protein
MTESFPLTDRLGGTRGTAPRIAICFFGITRSLRFTFPSIRDNVLAPARAAGETRVFAHLYRQSRVESIRTGEAVDIDPEEYRLLGADEVQLEMPDAAFSALPYDEIVAHGDIFENGLHSLGNLVRQLHSLRQVTQAALLWKPDIVLFCRPDLHYFDSFERPIARALSRRRPACYLPYWQAFKGYNDRFALVRGAHLARVYGLRAERALDYCSSGTGNGSRPLHSESLLRWVLQEERVRPLAVRAARIRANGETAPREFFDRHWITVSHTAIHYSRLPQRMKDGLHKALSIVQAGIDRALYGDRADPWDGWVKRGQIRVRRDAA